MLRKDVTLLYGNSQVSVNTTFVVNRGVIYNNTAANLYINVSSNRIPNINVYDYMIPSGASLTLPVQSNQFGFLLNFTSVPSDTTLVCSIILMQDNFYQNTQERLFESFKVCSGSPQQINLSFLPQTMSILNPSTCLLYILTSLGIPSASNYDYVVEGGRWLTLPVNTMSFSFVLDGSCTDCANIILSNDVSMNIQDFGFNQDCNNVLPDAWCFFQDFTLGRSNLSSARLPGGNIFGGYILPASGYYSTFYPERTVVPTYLMVSLVQWFDHAVTLDNATIDVTCLQNDAVEVSTYFRPILVGGGLGTIYGGSTSGCYGGTTYDFAIPSTANVIGFYLAGYINSPTTIERFWIENLYLDGTGMHPFNLVSNC